MRTALFELCLIIVAIAGIHTTRIEQKSLVNGKLYPATGSDMVLAVSGNDSVRTMSKDGYFNMKLKPGVWKVVVAKTRVINVVRENLEVGEGEKINLGEIRLSE